jgi:amidohydrolase
VVAWRRDIHQHPELGNRETRTAKIVADHLQGLGIEVRAGVAHTGVVGVLRGGRPGKVVALRADMDALPVTEQVSLPFASKVKATYNGQQVGVMHACGHDNHVAIPAGRGMLAMKAGIAGTVKFIFQPPRRARRVTRRRGLMIEEGAPKTRPSAISTPRLVQQVSVTYRSGPAMAASDQLMIVVKGRQTHGAQPWGGVDPIVVASQVVLGLQTIASRQINVTKVPAIITVGRIAGGNRGNIIPDSVIWKGRCGPS